MANYWTKKHDATALIGVALAPYETLVSSKKVKLFDHDYKENVNFCPRTGRKLWEEQDVCILFPDVPMSQLKTGMELGKFSLYCDYQKRYFCLGIIQTFTDDTESPDIVPIPEDLNIAQIKKDLKDLLSPLGLWDDENFGLISILDVGCRNPSSASAPLHTIPF